MLTLLSLVVTLSVLILVHEFGHFFAAKAVGIYAPRFSLGLGPRVAGFRVGETEFVLSAIPLGGYVKMAGMEGDEASEALEGGEAQEEIVDPSRSFDAKPIWARTLVITAGVIMNLLFAFVLFTVVALAYGETLDPSTRLDTTAVAGTPAAALAAAPYAARVTSVGGRPVASTKDVIQRLNDAPAGPVVVGLEGAAPVTLQLPVDPQARVDMLATIRFVHEPVVGKLAPGYPAVAAGVREGDRLAAVGGRPTRSWEEAVKQIETNGGKPIRVDVLRAGKPYSFTLTPRVDRVTDETGKSVERGKIGVSPSVPTTHRRIGAVEAVAEGWSATWGTVGDIFTYLHKMLTGQMSARNVGGLLTIADASGQSAKLGLDVFLYFMAMFSVNLAVLNILPIPILDGGHLLFLAIEGIRGRPLSVEARIRFSHVGLLIVVALMIWANGNDILRRLGI